MIETILIVISLVFVFGLGAWCGYVVGFEYGINYGLNHAINQYLAATADEVITIKSVKK